MRPAISELKLILPGVFCSYVAALELRIEKLERRLSYARSRKASVALHDPDAPPAADPSRKDSLAFIRAAIHRKAARTRENADVNSLLSDFGYLYALFVSHNQDVFLKSSTDQSTQIPETLNHPRPT